MVVPAQNVPVVRTLADSYRWAEHCLHVIRHTHGDSGIARLGTSLSTTSVSTAFSGIGSAELSLNTLACGMRAFENPECKTPTCVFAVEYAPESRYELRMHDHRIQHVFGDMTEFIDAGA